MGDHGRNSDVWAIRDQTYTRIILPLFIFAIELWYIKWHVVFVNRGSWIVGVDWINEWIWKERVVHKKKNVKWMLVI